MKINISVSAILVLTLLLFVPFLYEGEDLIPSDTEMFISTYLMNENETIATYMKDTEFEDEDLVKGREALSESLGFWMEYALEKNDRQLFEAAFVSLEKNFLTEEGFIYWKLSEAGEKEGTANALVDDLRIVQALFKAFDYWQDLRYRNTALTIGQFLDGHNKSYGVLTDFYEEEYETRSRVLTLSYIKPEPLWELEKRQVLSSKTTERMEELLAEMPLESGFFPKTYDLQTGKYHFDETVNMIDQVLVAISMEELDMSTEVFYEFVEAEMVGDGKVYGQYDLSTKAAAVDYESPALYGLLIIYALQKDELKFAEKLYDNMKVYKKTRGKYRGGYTVYQGNTHIFDNIVPLVAEQRLYNRGVIE